MQQVNGLLLTAGIGIIVLMFVDSLESSSVSALRADPFGLELRRVSSLSASLSTSGCSPAFRNGSGFED